MSRFLEAATLLLSNNYQMGPKNSLRGALLEIFRGLQGEVHGSRILSVLRPTCYTTRAASEKILKAAVRQEAIDLVQGLHGIGIKTDSLLPADLPWQPKLELVELLLRIAPGIFAGDQGGELLYRCPYTEKISYTALDIKETQEMRVLIVKKIIGLGANVNWCRQMREESVGMIQKRRPYYIHPDDYDTWRHRSPESPLAAAIEEGHAEIVKVLIDNGADVNQKNGEGYPPIRQAILSGNEKMVDLLIDSGAELDPSCIGQDTPEIVASLDEELRRKLQRIIDLDDISFTIQDLLEAADTGRHGIEQFEQEHPDVRPHHWERALHEAILDDYDLAFNMLLRSGVDPDTKAYCLLSTHRSPAPIELALKKVADDQDGSMAAYYVCGLAQAGAEVNVSQVLKRGWLWWNPFLLPILINHGLDLSAHGPQLLENIGLITTGDASIANFITSQGIPIDSYGTRFTCLQAAAHIANVPLLVWLLDQGANVNAPAHAQGGRTALQAVRKITTAELLIESGADVNAPPALNDGVTLLEALFDTEEEDDSISNTTKHGILRLALENGLQCGKVSGGHNMGVLGDIVTLGDISFVEIAIDQGASVSELSDIDGCISALAQACLLNDFEIIRLLMEKGTDINQSPYPIFGRTVLQAITSSKSPSIEMVTFLLSKGAEVNAAAAAYGGITALQGAAISGSLSVAMMLIEKGAFINAPGAQEEGRTAIEGAAEHGRLDMAALLLNAGAEGHPRLGLSQAISLARQQGHFVLADMINDHVKAKSTDRALGHHSDPFAANFNTHKLTASSDINEHHANTGTSLATDVTSLVIDVSLQHPPCRMDFSGHADFETDISFSELEPAIHNPENNGFVLNCDFETDLANSLFEEHL